MPPTPSASVVAPLGRRRVGRARSRLVAALGAAVAVAVLVLPAALAGAGGSLLDAGVGSSCASAAGTIHVGLVIDYGTVDSAGSSRTTTRQCVALPDSGKNRSGANALMAVDTNGHAGHVLRWSSSGLLCAIDGYPATGCGESSATGYRYWSYWHGGDSWSYSSVGPDSFTPKDGAVEGWHFIDGTGTTESGREPQSSPASPCPASPGSTIPPATSATTPATTPAGSGSGSGGSAAPTSSIVGGSSTTLSDDPSAGSGDGAATDSIAGASPDGSSGSGSGGTAGDEAALGANAPASSRPSGSHLPIGVILMVVAVVGLAGSAFVRFRTRPAP